MFTIFLHFKTLVENQFGVKIKTLRTDGGGEYVNNSFKSFCLDHGIHHQLSCPYTPQQNGVAERKHKHIVESVLSMLYQSNLPSSYWCSFLLLVLCFQQNGVAERNHPIKNSTIIFLLFRLIEPMFQPIENAEFQIFTKKIPKLEFSL